MTLYGIIVIFFFFSSRRRHTRCALVTGFQTCALPILLRARASTSGTTSPHGGGQAQRARATNPGGMRRRSRLLSIAVLVLVALAAPLPGARADDYSDPAYLQHDIDNVSRDRKSTRLNSSH